MLPIKDTKETINGLPLTKLKKLSKELGSTNELIQYAGGEFIALRGDYLKKVFQESQKYWAKYREYLLMSDSTLIEEAHFLSIVYASLGMEFGGGDKYIKRIWTQVFHYSNREAADINLVCWHLPAEKRFGIRRIAQKFLYGVSDWPTFGSEQWLDVVRQLGLTHNSLRKTLFDLSFTLKDRLRGN
jgi:hypothetical protein